MSAESGRDPRVRLHDIPIRYYVRGNERVGLTVVVGAAGAGKSNEYGVCFCWDSSTADSICKLLNAEEARLVAKRRVLHVSGVSDEKGE